MQTSEGSPDIMDQKYNSVRLSPAGSSKYTKLQLSTLKWIFNCVLCHRANQTPSYAVW